MPIKTILDPSCGRGEFLVDAARRMIAAGSINVLERIYAADSSKFNLSITKKRLENLIRNAGNQLVLEFTNVIHYNNINELSTKIGDMKFDVIVGNPPYQDTTDTGYALWNQIVKICIEKTLNKNGYIAMIHPPGFIGKQENKSSGKNDYSHFSKIQLIELHMFDNVQRDKFFPGVGTKICWYTAKNCNPVQLTNIVGYNNSTTFAFNAQLSEVGMLPSTIDPVSIKIHNKLINAGKSLKFIQKRELHYHTMKIKKTISECINKDYIYKSYFSHKIIRYSNFKFSDFKEIKLMIPQTSTIDNSFIDKNCNVSEDLFYVTCKSLKEANDLKNYLNSDLIKYIGKMYRPGRNLGSLLLTGMIPSPDVNFNWTNEELLYIKSVSN